MLNILKALMTFCSSSVCIGVGGGQHRKVVDSFEDQLSNSATRLERSRLKYERLSKVIISMKAGIGHLQDKLESFREEIKGNTYSVTDEAVTEVLRECELCFVQLNKRIKAGDDEARRAHITDGSGADGGSRGGSAVGTARHGGGFASAATQQLARSHLMGSVANLMPPELDETASRMNTLRPYNQRIDLCKFTTCTSLWLWRSWRLRVYCAVSDLGMQLVLYGLRHTYSSAC